MQDMSKDAFGVSEAIAAAILTMEELQECQIAIYPLLFDLGMPYRQQAKDDMNFQLHILKNLNLRADFRQKRLLNEITLVRNPLFRVLILQPHR